jgi:REP element-mobilizing transposase RayT
MKFNPDIHHRHSIRLKEYDYSRAGAYFVTICAWQRECLFGDIVDGVMVLNDAGRIVAGEWERTPDIRPQVELDVYAIMPNHFHAIVVIHDNDNDGNVGAHRMRPNFIRPEHLYPDTSENIELCIWNDSTANHNRAHVGAPLRRQSGSIVSIVAGFKSASTKRINHHRTTPGCPVWQRNYYERVIRNDHELSRAREYIVNNPLKWQLDKENPVNQP